MVLAAIATLALPDWGDSGTARPLFLLALPLALGIVGAIVALRQRRPVWALISTAWGLILVWALFTVITLVGGP